MSSKYGETFQIAYVVDDIEKHIDHWTKVLGVGPFFLFPLPLDFKWAKIRGKDVAPDADVYNAIAVAYSGDTMIELIEPGSLPSTYREFLEAGNKSVHHIGTFTDRLDEQLAAARDEGLDVVLEGELPFSRFAYIETDKGFPGTMVELIEPRPEMFEFLDMIKDAARNWDGKERTRSL